MMKSNTYLVMVRELDEGDYELVTVTNEKAVGYLLADFIEMSGVEIAVVEERNGMPHFIFRKICY